ncbi:MAG: hypothetical protein ACFCD0_06695 [Gemmataceae bacterium]
MPRVTLKPRARKYRDEIWELQLGRHDVVLRDEYGEIFAEFDREDSPKHIVFPSFWESVKYFTVVDEDRQRLQFDISNGAMAVVQEYIDTLTLDAGPDAVRKLRTQGSWQLVGGIGLLMLGAIVLVFALAQAASGNHVRRYTGIGVLVGGGILTARGISLLNKAARVADMIEDEDDDYPE